jgi:hypothetical protein
VVWQALLSANLSRRRAKQAEVYFLASYIAPDPSSDIHAICLLPRMKDAVPITVNALSLSVTQVTEVVIPTTDKESWRSRVTPQLTAFRTDPVARLAVFRSEPVPCPPPSQETPGRRELRLRPAKTDSESKAPVLQQKENSSARQPKRKLVELGGDDAEDDDGKKADVMEAKAAEKRAKRAKAAETRKAKQAAAKIAAEISKAEAKKRAEVEKARTATTAQAAPEAERNLKTKEEEAELLKEVQGDDSGFSEINRGRPPANTYATAGICNCTNSHTHAHTGSPWMM